MRRSVKPPASRKVGFSRRYYERTRYARRRVRVRASVRYRPRGQCDASCITACFQDAGLALAKSTAILNATDVAEGKAIAARRLPALLDEIAESPARDYRRSALCRYDHTRTDCQIGAPKSTDDSRQRVMAPPHLKFRL